MEKHRGPTRKSASVWTTALPHDRCNFHPTRRATHAYIGTPLCHDCSARLDAPDNGAVGAEAAGGD